MEIRPFIKWVGGKTRLLKQYQKYYPKELINGKIKKYFEPFVGGGAVFIDIAQKFKIESAFLTDINEDLIMAYKVIQRSPDDLIDCLKTHSNRYYKSSEENQQKYFYEVRTNFNFQKTQIDYQRYSDNWISRTAQLIFLNKTCFNGLFRLNKKGEFNASFGKYKNPKILDGKNIIGLSKILQIAEINIGNFDSTEHKIDEDSFVYFDPPYRPISKTFNFTLYSKYNFGESEQIQLAEYFHKLHIERKPKLMLSNSDPKNKNPDDTFFDELFNEFYIHKVSVNRIINCKGNKRGSINELLITNYKT